MITPEHTPVTSAEQLASRPRGRRYRRPARFAVALLVALGLAVSLTGCSPEAVARAAIEHHWNPYNTDCAMRIVDRESNFQADAVNPYSGATGLFQMMPLHADWIQAELGYSWGEMTDATKNAHAAKRLSTKAYYQTGDGWWPWRLDGQPRPGGGCPA